MCWCLARVRHWRVWQRVPRHISTDRNNHTRSKFRPQTIASMSNIYKTDIKGSWMVLARVVKSRNLLYSCRRNESEDDILEKIVIFRSYLIRNKSTNKSLKTVQKCCDVVMSTLSTPLQKLNLEKFHNLRWYHQHDVDISCISDHSRKSTTETLFQCVLHILVYW